jgi:hypothetical protein
VRVDGIYYKFFEYSRGLRQGCPTSSLLFDILIDDLLNEIKGIWIPNTQEKILGIFFADGTLLLCKNLRNIKEKTEILEKWTREKDMEVNSEKCDIILINKKKAQSPK